MKKRYLMNKDRPVLSYYYDEVNGVLFNIEIINNDYLPYSLKNYLCNSADIDERQRMIQASFLSDFLASRTLNLSRDNAKVILNVSALPQSMRIKDKLKIVDACKGLTMIDSFWLKDENENTSYADVGLLNNKLSDASYKIAILGKHISAARDELIPDLTTEGMFPKFWKREDGFVYMYKTDRFSYACTKAEVESSRILKEAGVNCVSCSLKEQNGILFSVSKCIASSDYSLVEMQEIKDYCEHMNADFLETMEKRFKTAFANMCVADYVLANTDRHFNNFGVLVNNETNEIFSFAPLYDHNQCLIADSFETAIDELVYEPTGMTYKDAVTKYSKYCNIDFDKVNNLPPKCEERWQNIKKDIPNEYKHEKEDCEPALDSNDFMKLKE